MKTKLFIFLLLSALLLTSACSLNHSSEKGTSRAEETHDSKAPNQSDAASISVSEPYDELPLPTVTYIDTDEYFRERSSVISIEKASVSSLAMNEGDVVKMLSERGFLQFPVTSSYTMDGELTDEEEISEGSEEKHPFYETYFRTDSGEIWSIVLIRDAVIAIPLTYLVESGAKIPVFLSEKETVMSYDSISDQFYETIPLESEATVVRVERIDANTLNSWKPGND